MVSVPVTSRRSVEVQPLGDERFRYVAPRNFVGPAIEQFGRALGDAAETFDQIEGLKDDADKLELQNAYLADIASARSEFGSLRGKEPEARLEETVSSLTKRAEKLLSSARSPRARALAKRAFDPLLANARAFMVEHANSQMFEFKGNQLEAQAGTFAENAVEAHDAPDFLVYLISGQETLGKLQSHHGWSDDELSSKQAAYTSNVHRRVIARLQAKGRVAEAAAWAEQHAAEIIDTDETEVWRGLQPALDEAEIDNGIAEVERLMAGRDPEDAPVSPSQQPVDEDDPDPLRGIGRITTSPSEHQKRGRLAVDIAAPAGTPIYPPMSGKVSDKGYDPKGNGHFIRVKHPNGYETTYLHMKGASPLNVGDEVSAVTVLGGVGSTGHSTGPHLDYSVRDARGRAVDPLAARWEEGPLPAYRPERNDKAAMYDAAREVATRRKYSRRQYDDLLRRVDAIVAREDNLKDRAEQAAVEDAMEIVAGIEQAGGQLIRVDQIPNFGSLPAAARRQFLGIIEQNTRPQEVAANGERVLSLELMSVYEPETFARQDLRLFRHEMTPAEFASLAMKQGEMRKQGPKAPVALAHGQIWTMINRYGADVGLRPNSDDEDERKRTMRVFDAVRNDLRTVTENKRQATDDEVKAAFDRATMEVVVHGRGLLGADETVRRFDVKPGERRSVSIPNAVRDRIISSFQRTMGRRPSEPEIAQTFVDNKGKPGFW